MALGLLWILFLVVCNGFFVAAEFAIVKIRASQIEIKIREGHPFGALVQQIHTHLDAYLSATQLGITITSLAVGWFGESYVADGLLRVVSWGHWTLPQALVHQIAFGLAFLFITVLHIIIGELVPKSIAIQTPMRVSFMVAAPLRLFYVVFSPFIRILNFLAWLVMRIVGIGQLSSGESHSVEELRLLLEQGESQGVIHPAEYDIIKNVFYSTEKTVKQIMVPRTQIEAIPVTSTVQEVVAQFVREEYSRLPVYRDNLDNIIGILYAKEALRALSAGEHAWKEKILKPHFVPESKKIITLLREFQAKRYHMALVVDEFGSTSGLVTLEDVIEELVGEIQDEYDAELPMIEKTGKSDWRIQGLAPIVTVNHELPIPLPETGDYDTVSGYLNTCFGRIAQTGDKMTRDGYEIIVLKASRRRVELVKLRQVA